MATTGSTAVVAPPVIPEEEPQNDKSDVIPNTGSSNEDPTTPIEQTTTDSENQSIGNAGTSVAELALATETTTEQPKEEEEEEALPSATTTTTTTTTATTTKNSATAAAGKAFRRFKIEAFKLEKLFSTRKKVQRLTKAQVWDVLQDDFHGIQQDLRQRHCCVTNGTIRVIYTPFLEARWKQLVEEQQRRQEEAETQTTMDILVAKPILERIDSNHSVVIQSDEDTTTESSVISLQLAAAEEEEEMLCIANDEKPDDAAFAQDCSDTESITEEEETSSSILEDHQVILERKPQVTSDADAAILVSVPTEETLPLTESQEQLDVEEEKDSESSSAVLALPVQETISDTPHPSTVAKSPPSVKSTLLDNETEHDDSIETSNLLPPEKRTETTAMSIPTQPKRKEEAERPSAPSLDNVTNSYTSNPSGNGEEEEEESTPTEHVVVETKNIPAQVVEAESAERRTTPEPLGVSEELEDGDSELLPAETEDTSMEAAPVVIVEELASVAVSQLSVEVHNTAVSAKRETLAQEIAQVKEITESWKEDSLSTSSSSSSLSAPSFFDDNDDDDNQENADDGALAVELAHVQHALEEAARLEDAWAASDPRQKKRQKKKASVATHNPVSVTEDSSPLIDAQRLSNQSAELERENMEIAIPALLVDGNNNNNNEEDDDIRSMGSEGAVMDIPLERENAISGEESADPLLMLDSVITDITNDSEVAETSLTLETGIAVVDLEDQQQLGDQAANHELSETATPRTDVSQSLKTRFGTRFGRSAKGEVVKRLECKLTIDDELDLLAQHGELTTNEDALELQDFDALYGDDSFDKEELPTVQKMVVVGISPKGGSDDEIEDQKKDTNKRKRVKSLRSRLGRIIKPSSRHDKKETNPSPTGVADIVSFNTKELEQFHADSTGLANDEESSFSDDAFDQLLEKTSKNMERFKSPEAHLVDEEDYFSVLDGSYIQIDDDKTEISALPGARSVARAATLAGSDPLADANVGNIGSRDIVDFDEVWAKSEKIQIQDARKEGKHQSMAKVTGDKTSRRRSSISKPLFQICDEAEAEGADHITPKTKNTFLKDRSAHKTAEPKRKVHQSRSSKVSFSSKSPKKASKDGPPELSKSRSASTSLADAERGRSSSRSRISLFRSSSKTRRDVKKSGGIEAESADGKNPSRLGLFRSSSRGRGGVERSRSSPPSKRSSSKPRLTVFRSSSRGRGDLAKSKSAREHAPNSADHEAGEVSRQRPSKSRSSRADDGAERRPRPSKSRSSAHRTGDDEPERRRSSRSSSHKSSTDAPDRKHRSSKSRSAEAEDPEAPRTGRSSSRKEKTRRKRTASQKRRRKEHHMVTETLEI